MANQKKTPSGGSLLGELIYQGASTNFYILNADTKSG
jgi:hypothetical protein